MQQLYQLPQKNSAILSFLLSSLISLSIIISLWVGTEYVYYQGKDASEALEMSGPFSIIIWTLQSHGPQLDAMITKGLQVSFILAVMLIFSMLFLRWYLQRDLKQTDVHGSSRWLEWKDLKHSGLLEQGKGIYIGQWRARLSLWEWYKFCRVSPGTELFQDAEGVSYFLRDSSDKHVIVVAPTGSGKGRGVVIPNLLSWQGSVIAHDIKGENYRITAGYRKKILGQDTFFFNPVCADGTGARWNALSEIRKGIFEVRDTQAVVDIIIDPDGKGKPSHWDKTADAFLVGVILHALYVGPNKTLNGVSNMLSDPERGIEELLLSMINTEHDPDGQMGWVNPSTGKPTRTHPVIAAAAQEMRSKHPNELSGVLSTALSYLSLYRDPLIARNTSGSDFSVQNLMKGERPASLYIIIPPSEMRRVKPLTRLLVNQLCVQLMENVPNSDNRNLNAHKHKMLLLLDEFTSLGRMESLKESLSFMRGYGIRTLLICQDLEQLNEIYGERTPILGHCKTKIFFAPNSDTTAERISRFTGEATVLKYSKSYSENNMQNVNESATEVRRPLLTPDEVMRLPEDTSLLIIEGIKPILAKKICYDRNYTFKERSEIAPPEESDRLAIEEHFKALRNVDECKPASDDIQASSGSRSFTESDLDGVTSIVEGVQGFLPER